MNVIIIEDERLTAEDLRDTLLEIQPDIRIVTFLSSVAEAVAYFKNNAPPDLIFSDIQLGDGLSFDIFDQINISTPIIFCTAYNEYALNAFKTNGIHYVLKPFDKETIREALVKYETLQTTLNKNPKWLADLHAYFRDEKQPAVSSVLVYHKDQVIPVRLEDIALFYIDNGLTQLLTFEGEQYVVNKTLNELEESIGKSFFRVNRQYIIHRNAVKSIGERLSRKADIYLNIPYAESISLSKEKITPFLEWLEE